MDEELLQDFIAETTEGLDSLDDDLIKLENAPDDHEVIDRIFRVIHTIKGTCGFLDMKRLEVISHATESLLSKFRSRELTITPSLISLVLECVDRIRFIIQEVSQHSREPRGDDSDLVQRLQAVLDGKLGAEEDRQGTPAPQPASTSKASPPTSGESPSKPSAAEIEEAMIAAETAAFAAQNTFNPLFDTEAPEETSLTSDEAEMKSAFTSARDGYSPTSAQPASGEARGVARSSPKPDVSEDELEQDMVVFEDYSGESPDVIATAFHAWHAVKNKFEHDEQTGMDADYRAHASGHASVSGGFSDHGMPAERGFDDKSSFGDMTPSNDKETQGSGGEAERTVRVRLGLIEHLMTTVSELVLTRNQLLQLLNNQQNSHFSVSLNRLNIITNELQDSVMKTRMQPIRVIISRMNRTVHDLQRELGKQLKLVVKGGDTEIDRQLLEVLRDPIMHIVRNAADHGIESIERRREKNKPDHGTITFEAKQQDGHIMIVIGDDGAGIDPDKLRETVVRRGLASLIEARAYTAQQLYRFMFMPGFSTTTSVSAISGRGVGLDVVKSNIEKIGGAVEIKSTVNSGTTFTIKLPLTLAIVDSLIVRVGKERFAVPQISIVELVHVRTGGDHYIDHVQNTPVLRLRDRMFPLISLRQLLDIDALDNEDGRREQKSLEIETTVPTLSTTIDVTPSEESERGKDGFTHQETQATRKSRPTMQSPERRDGVSPSHVADRYLHKDENFVIVTKVGNFEFGMVVDVVYDTEQIVVKPTSSVLRDIPYFNGNTILGDGKVIMIIDPNGVVSVVNEVENVAGIMDENMSELGFEGNKVTYLLFEAGGDTQKAVPVGVVSRLDEVELSEVEYPNQRPTVQYRDTLMPLIDLNGVPSLQEEGKTQVIVFSSGGNSAGLVVDRVLDITDEVRDIQPSNLGRGVVGTAIVNQKATDIIDPQYYWQLAFPHFKETRMLGQDADAPEYKPTVVLIDPNTFFRDLLVPYITAQGFRVISLSDTLQAIDLCNRGAPATVIMVDMDRNSKEALSFIQTIDTNSPWSAVPVYGLSENPSKLTGISSEEKIKFVNFFDKHDSQGIIESISLYS